MKRHLPVLFYAILALLVMGPLLRPGYLLMLDVTRFLEGSVHYEIPLFGLDGYLSEGLPFYLLSHLMSLALPQWLVQKLLFLAALLLAGYGAHRLCPASTWGKYFAGILYMINPFIYARLLAGQIGIAMSYSLMPFAIYYFIRMLHGGDRRSLILTVLVLSLMSVFSYHGPLLAILAFAVLFVARIIHGRHDRELTLRITRRVALSAAFFLLLNAYWLVSPRAPAVLGQFGAADISFFAPQPTSGLSVGVSLLSMHGFWRDGYVYANDLIPGWWLVFFAILFLAIYGLASRHDDREHGVNVRGIGLIGIIALVLALGASVAAVRPLFEFLWEHVFVFRGFRDSQKFVGLLVLAYSYLGGLGCARLASACTQATAGRRVIRTIAIAVMLLLPVANSFTMFNGFWGQVAPTQYPEEWHEANRYLNHDSDDFSILFLPWHAYMDYGWVPNRDKRLASPARHFFDRPVVQGDNAESGPIYTQSTNPTSRYIEVLLSNRGDIDNMGELLAPLNVKYVILVDEADYESYDFLYQQADLSVALKTSGLTLFRNDYPTSRAYGVESVVGIDSLEDFIELSRSQDVTRNLYVFEHAPGDEEQGQAEGLSLVENSPVTYRVAGAESPYTVFTIPQNVATAGWSYNGTESLANLGFIPAFASSSEGAEIRYERFFRVHLPLYGVSVLGLLAMAAYCIRRKVPREPPALPSHSPETMMPDARPTREASGEW